MIMHHWTACWNDYIFATKVKIYCNVKCAVVFILQYVQLFDTHLRTRDGRREEWWRRRRRRTGGGGWVCVCWDAPGFSDLPAQHRGADLQCDVWHRGGWFVSRQQWADMAKTTRAEQQRESCQSKPLFYRTLVLIVNRLVSLDLKRWRTNEVVITGSV